MGAGALSGVLIGEGAYGLAYIADTTYPPYWWGQIVVGLVLLLSTMVCCLDRLRDRALSLGICGLTAVAFVAVYSQGSTLFWVAVVANALRSGTAAAAGQLQSPGQA